MGKTHTWRDAAKYDMYLWSDSRAAHLSGNDSLQTAQQGRRPKKTEQEKVKHCFGAPLLACLPSCGAPCLWVFVCGCLPWGFRVAFCRKSSETITSVSNLLAAGDSGTICSMRLVSPTRTSTSFHTSFTSGATPELNRVSSAVEHVYFLLQVFVILVYLVRSPVSGECPCSIATNPFCV